jgi:hypothetical protein
MTTINGLTLFREMIAVYYEHIKRVYKYTVLEEFRMLPSVVHADTTVLYRVAFCRRSDTYAEGY